MARTLKVVARFAAGLLALFVAGAAAAEDTENTKQGFVARYVAALVAHDAAALKELYHPASLACINRDNRDFYDFIVEKELKNGDALRGGYRLTRFGAVNPQVVAINEMDGLYPNPVPATHEFDIDTPLGAQSRALEISRMLAQKDGAWFIVMGCPTETGLAAFREQRARAERDDARARRLTDELSEPLRTELLRLLAENRRIDAIKHYEVAAQVDLKTAVQVIAALGEK